MAGITDLPFRRLCTDFGAAMATGEMTASNPALRATLKSSLRSAQPGFPLQPGGPRAVQIVGTEPRDMADAAAYQADLGAEIIDINMGCPAKKVCKKAAGSALLKDEPLVEKILVAVVKSVDVPVTLKIRTGWDRESRNAAAIARIAEQAGIAALTVHGRTRDCRFRGSAEYDTIAAVVDAVAMPVIANGDIDSAQKAQKILRYTAADAVMVGRAAQGKPWIFNEINALLSNPDVHCGLFNGKSLNFNDANTLGALIIRHLQMIDQYYSCIEYGHFQQKSGRKPYLPLAVKIARKHICWYFEQLKLIIASQNKDGCDRQPGSKSTLASSAFARSAIDGAKAVFNRLECNRAQVEFVQQFFGDLPTTGDIAA